MSDDDQLPVGVVNGDKPRLPPPPAAEHFVSTMGLSTHRMQVMKASFFGAEDIVSPVPPSRPLTSTGKGRHVVSARAASGRSAPQQSLQNGLSPSALLKRDAYPQPSHLSGFSDSRAESRLDTSYYEQLELSSSVYQESHLASSRTLPHRPQTTVSALQAQTALITARHDLHTLVARENSLVRGNTRLVADTGLFLGRSFRVGWGPNWTLAHSGTSIGPVESDPGIEVHRQPLFSPLVTGRGRGGRGGVGSSSSGSHPLRVVIERVDVGAAGRPEATEDTSALVSCLLTSHAPHVCR